MSSWLSSLLGCDSATKLLIIHADDLGLAHSVNRASFRAIELGAVTSASIMVTCPWFPEAARRAAGHPEHDLGVHLTVTSEWPDYKWRPTGTSRSGFVDALGYFHSTSELVSADRDELDAELAAQVHLGLRAGLRPSHIDSHMFALFSRPPFLASYLRVAHKFGLTPLIPDGLLSGPLAIRGTNVLSVRSDVQPEDWLSAYIEIIKNLKPGLNQLIVHLGYNDAELQAITGQDVPWGAKWRQRDFDVVTSTEFRSACSSDDIRLINWRSIQSGKVGNWIAGDKETAVA